MVRSPVEICLGTRPNQAAKSRPLENASPVPIACTIALEMIGPMPGTLIRRSQPTSCRARAVISPLIEPAPVLGQSLDETHHARRQHIGWRSENARQLSAQESQTLSDRNAALQEEGTNLIDDAGALTDQSLAYAMQRLEVELIGGLRRHELHRGTLHGFGDCLRGAEVI